MQRIHSINTQRYALGVQYNGSHFCGWQAQISPPVRAVASVLSQALSTIANHPIALTAAGRTDTGVHASMQVVHFDTSAVRPDHAWLTGSNTLLPPDCSVSWIKAVSQDFHARFSALGRHYHYFICNKPYRQALSHQRYTWVAQHLDIEAMQAAANLLVGEHNFSSFRSSECQAKSPVRTLRTLQLSRIGDQVVIYAHANAFLHHMVRNIVGVLIAVGQGKKPIMWAQQVLLAQDRRVGGVTAKADGLYLSGVDYPQQWQLPIWQSPL